MGLFNPSGDVNLTPERMIVDESASTAIAGISDALAGFARSKTSGQPSGPNRDDLLKKALIQGLEKAEALSVTKGDAAGRVMYKRVLRNYMAEGGDLNATRREEIEALTGKPFDFVMLGETNAIVADLISKPEYRTNIQASYALNPEFSDDEHAQWAVEEMSKDAAIQVEMKRAERGGKEYWERGGQDAYDSTLTKFVNATIGAANIIAAQGGDIKVADIRSQQEAWQQLKLNIGVRPRGVTEEQFRPFKERVELVNQMFETILRNEDEAVVSKERIDQFFNIIGSHAEDTPQNNLAIEIFKSNPESWLAMNTGSAAVTALTTAANLAMTPTRQSMGVGSMSSDINDEVRTKVQGMSDREKSENARGLLAQTQGFTEKDLNDPAMFDIAVASLQQAGIGMQEIQKFQSLKAVQDLYSDGVLNLLEGVAKKQPRKGQELIGIQRRGLAQVRVANQKNLESLLDPTMLKVENGGLVLDKEKLIADFASSYKGSGADPRLKAVLSAVEGTYGGDFMAAITSAVNMNIHDPANPITQEQVMLLRDLGERSLVHLQDIRQRMKTEDYLNSVDSRMQSLEASYSPAPLQEQSGTAESGGEPITVAPIGAGEGYEPLKSVLAVKEAGSYNTLFGNSEREGKPFAGTDVTKMTIGDLMEFSSPRGQYGQWVKENNPEGVVSTPMGKYQIIGTTLRQLQKEMGLPLNTMFTREVQDAMFQHLVQKRLDRGGNNPAKLRQEFRNEWAGLKNVPDAELDAIIKAAATGDPLDYDQLANNNLGQNTLVSETPQQRPRSILEAGRQDTLEEIEFKERESGTRRRISELNEQAQKILADAGQDSVLQYDTQEEAEIAFARGKLEKGTVVLIDGKLTRVK